MKERGELKGNTLRVYLQLLKSAEGRVGVRQVQRALGFSSPSLAQYHLEKLVEMGMARADRGDYHLVKEVHVDVLREFVRLGTLIIPRFVIYATMLTVLFAYFVSQLSTINFYSAWALIFAALATGICWYETIAAWRRLP